MLVQRCGTRVARDGRARHWPAADTCTFTSARRPSAAASSVGAGGRQHGADVTEAAAERGRRRTAHVRPGRGPADGAALFPVL